MAKKRPPHKMFFFFLVLILFGIAETNSDVKGNSDAKSDIEAELKSGVPNKNKPHPDDPNSNAHSPNNGLDLGDSFDWLNHFADNGQKQKSLAFLPEAPPQNRPAPKPDSDLSWFPRPDEILDGNGQQSFFPGILKNFSTNQQQGNNKHSYSTPSNQLHKFHETKNDQKEPLIPENFDELKSDNCYERCKNEKNGKEYCHHLCPLSVGDGDMKSWLQQIWFNKTATGDDGKCKQKNDLTFIFCPPKEKNNQTCRETQKKKIFICFQSKLNPQNGMVEQILEVVPNSNEQLYNICNAHSAAENMSNEVDQEQLQEFEQSGQKMHGFSVKFADEGGKFLVETSYSNNSFEFNVDNDTCLALKMFGSSMSDMFVSVDGEQQFLSQTYSILIAGNKFIPIQSAMNETEEKENGQKPNGDKGKKKKMKKPKLEELANGVALNSDCYKGPWLIGMDMMLQFEDGPFYIKTFTNGGAEDKCHPQVSYMSSEIVPIKKCKKNDKKDASDKNEFSCEVGENVWVKAGNKSSSDQVKIDSKNGTGVELLPNNNKSIELIFAVPNRHKLYFTVEALDINNSDCRGILHTFDFNLNNNDPKCQLRFSQMDVNLTLIANNNTGKLQTMGINGQKMDIGINGIEVQQLNVNNGKNYNETITNIVLPQNCGVKNKRVQDFGRVIGSSNKFIMQFTLMPSSRTSKCRTSMFKLEFRKEYTLLMKKKTQNE